MLEYTVSFQKGSRIGARSLRMVSILAHDASHAMELANAAFPTAQQDKYRIVRVDYFDPETGHLVIER